MSSKETPKKVYRALDPPIDPSTCRLCRAVGDASHRKHLFRTSNRPLLMIAEQLCGHPIVQDPSLPHLLCRPCERRLKNTSEFQKVLLETEEIYQRRQTSRVKRCVDISPSIRRPQKSRLVSSTPAARTSLSFDACEVSYSQNPDSEVNLPFSILYSYIIILKSCIYLCEICKVVNNNIQYANTC